MAELIDELKQKYDYVLMDTPALLPFADTEILAQYADGLIMVVRQAFAKKSALQTGNKFLALYPDKTIGCIVNHTNDDSNYGYYDFSHRSNSFIRSEKPKTFDTFGQFGRRKPKNEIFIEESDLH